MSQSRPGFKIYEGVGVGVGSGVESGVGSGVGSGVESEELGGKPGKSLLNIFLAIPSQSLSRLPFGSTPHFFANSTISALLYALDVLHFFSSIPHSRPGFKLVL